MDKKIVLLILLLLTLTAIPAGASVVDDAGAYMVQKGMEFWMYSIGDSMMALGNGTAPANHTQAPSLIVAAITYTVDPYQMAWVQNWWQTMLVFFILVTFIAIMGGGAMVLISKIFPDAANKMTWVMGETGTFNFRKWISTIVLALVFPFLTLFGVYFILQLNYIVSALLTTSVLSAVPPTIDNIIAYLIMALMYLILTLVMAVRNVIIVLFAAGSLGLAALYLIPQLRELVKSIFVYFIIIVFMQPALIFMAAVGVIFLTSLPAELHQCTGVLYVALFLILAAFGLVCILGTSIVKMIIRAG